MCLLFQLYLTIFPHSFNVDKCNDSLSYGPFLKHPESDASSARWSLASSMRVTPRPLESQSGTVSL